MEAAHGSASLLEHFYQVERATVISTETQLEIDRKAFTVYRVEVVPIGGLPWIVAKRFSEFSDLRAALGAIDANSRGPSTKQDARHQLKCQKRPVP